MSGKCGHQALLHVCGDDKYPSLVETHRFYDLVQSLPNPTRQYPSLIFFLGSGTKSEALHALYPRNKLKTALSEDVARIHIDQRTVRQRSPVLFADADMTLEVRHGSGTGCHYEHTLPVTWASSVNHVQTVFDHVVSRVLLATANIFVLFVDDFQDLDRVGQSLRRWIRVGVTSDSPLESRPRLVLVVNEERQSSEDMRSLYIQLELDRLTRLFSLVTTVYLQGDCDTDNFYRPLEVHLHEESRAMREKLIAIGWCFSAIHVERLFRLRLQHVASSQIEEFHHIRAIRKTHPLTASVTSMPLSEVIEYAQHRLISYQSTARLIASSLLLDAFPDGAHLFNSGYVFDTLYTNICRDAIGAIYTRNEHFPSFLTAEIRKSFERHWHILREQDISALELHRHALGEERKLWRHFKSSKTCVGCLTSKATHVQKCQHALCNACVRAHSSARGTDFIASYNLQRRV